MKKWTSILGGLAAFAVFAAPTEGQTPDIKADASLLMDVETGKILYSDNIDELLPMASMAKMMTEYLVNEAIEEGELSWDDEVSISEEVAALSQNESLSNVYLRTDGTYTVEDLYEALAIESANGATIALAEAVAGSEEAFVEQMNEKAEEMGIDEYEFVNSSGLNNASMDGYHPEGTDADAENQMSARGTAQLAYHLLQDYPEILEVSSTEETVFREGDELDEMNMTNWNHMLGGTDFSHAYEGVDGIKTGNTDAAGFAFTGTVEQEDTRLLSVVMRTNSIDARFEETETLYDYGFDEYSAGEVITEGEQTEEYPVLSVPDGQEQEVDIVAATDLSLPIIEGEEDLYSTSAVLSEEALDEDGALSAPIEAGDEVGRIALNYEGENGDIYLSDELENNATVPLVAAEDVERSNWFVLSMRSIGDFFSGLWDRTTETVGGWFS
ncbi:D-alanyl-D-alanine carboxypeptidase family protein [Natribacillus halophilus]|uniref:serine-type D-Ala-D-Ala carboxypeptidase n=1 Tax=Natribacillus halophilus TaxID=549003 RepID=A0A1G8S8V8_9BACI|nr:D-alanyl-D-alanine carboxypeptidase family protein [Natribacillus halophilus]SDJ25627.1 D-Ala-D-Ala carboxypeptidase A. Serine peptidase. MEROPS family S11 [Natribacillus halophilus]